MPPMTNGTHIGIILIACTLHGQSRKRHCTYLLQWPELMAADLLVCLIYQLFVVGKTYELLLKDLVLR